MPIWTRQVFDAVTLLDPWFQSDPGLVCIVGRELLHDKYFPVVNTKQAPTEPLLLTLLSAKNALAA